MKKYALITTLSLLGFLAGCGCCNKRSCTPEPETCQEQTCEQPCKEDLCECEVAQVTPQQERVSGPFADQSVKWDKEDYA